MPPRKGAPNRRGVARREQILEAAVELFARRGYRGTGLLALAERVGMSHVGILRHFGTKEDLLRAVMQRRDDVLAATAAQLEATGLRGLQDVSMPFEPEILTRLATVLRAESFEPDAPLHDYFVKNHRRVLEQLSGQLRAAQRKGEIRRDVDPDVKAVEIVAFAIGLETQWLLVPDLVDREKVRRSFVRALTDDLTRTDAPRAKRANGSRQPRAN